MTDINNKVTMLDILSQLSTTNNTVIEVKNTVDNLTPSSSSVPNIIRHGTLTENNGIISGFSATNYATIPYSFKPNSDGFEIVIKFKLYNFPKPGERYEKGEPAYVYSTLGNTNSVLYVTQFGTTTYHLQWDFYPGGTAHSDNHYVDLDTYYWVKTSIINEYLKLEMSEDGETYTTVMGFDDDFVFPESTINLGIGNNLTYPLDGEIDLRGCYMKLGNDVVWTGMVSA